MPSIVDECYTVLQEINRNGMVIMLVEQNTERALSVADKVCFLEAGNPGFSGSVAEVSKDSTLHNSFLGYA